jgi:signal transduction histidine kinase
MPGTNAAVASAFWRYVRLFAAPAVLLLVAAVALALPWWLSWRGRAAEPDADGSYALALADWLGLQEKYDREAMREWVREARVSTDTLRDLLADYLGRLHAYHRLMQKPEPADDKEREALACERQQALMRVLIRREDVQEHLRGLGNPPTKIYSGQLPLFPIIYGIEVQFSDPDLPEGLQQPVVWDSQLPRRDGQYRTLEPIPIAEHAAVTIQYQLHTYTKRLQEEQARVKRQQLVTVLAAAGTLIALVWMWLAQRRERERDRQRTLAQHQIDQAERLLLEEELRRKEAEHLREEAERTALEQQLAAQTARQQALELKSQLYASIGIMAGSYAHNIKNLLVRPNDLLVRCLEEDGLSSGQEEMLQEVRESLGTVTERLQQILRTVRRDPARAELSRLDLNAVLREEQHTWKDLAREKWKLNLEVDLAPEPLWLEADLSHLQQAIENLLFNARDATFEMRNHQRNLARSGGENGPADRRQALLAAAAWKGHVVLRTRRQGDRAVLEVQDNGVGMDEEVRRRCTETHFSTKRDNALYEGQNTGMGLGLSFVVAILEHQHATLAIDSAPLRGTTFRISFRLAE